MAQRARRGQSADSSGSEPFGEEESLQELHIGLTYETPTKRTLVRGQEEPEPPKRRVIIIDLE